MPAAVDRKLNTRQQELMADNLSLRYWVLNRSFRRYRASPRLWEELEDAATDGLIKAAYYFHPERKCKFSPFAVMCITRSCVQALRRGTKIQAREWNGYDYEKDGNDFTDYNQQKGRAATHSGFDSIDNSDELRTWRRALAQYLNKCHPTHRDCLRGALAGRTMQSMADDLGISKERVRQKVKMAVETIKERLAKWRRKRAVRLDNINKRAMAAESISA